MSIKPQDLVGLQAVFDGQSGKRLTGIITACVDGGFAEPGHIPDFQVTVRGASGREMTVSMVESHMTLPDR